MQQLKPLSVNRLHEVVVEALESKILAGDYKVGELLPPEKTLSEQLNVGRRAVREALRALQAKGLVEIRMGVGTRVVRNDLDGFLSTLLDNVSNYLMQNRAELDHILEIRGVLEKYALSRILATDPQKCAETLEALIERQREAAKENDTKLYQRYHLEYHMAIIDWLENPIISMFYDQILKLTQRRMFKSGSKPAIMRSSVREHSEIVKLLKEGADFSAIEAALDRHLANTKKHFLQ